MVSEAGVTQHGGQRVVFECKSSGFKCTGGQGLQRQHTHMHAFVPGSSGKVTVCIRPVMTAELPVSEGAGGEGEGGDSPAGPQSHRRRPPP